MIAEVARNRDEIAALCRRFGVRRLELFGSAARGDFDPRSSDIDLIVVFQEPRTDPLRQYVGLTEAIDNLLGYRVGLVSEEKRSNPWLWAEIDRCRKVIYDADPAITVSVTISRSGLASPRGDRTPARLFEARRAASSALEVVLEEETADGNREEIVWGALAWSVLGVDRSLGRVVRDDHYLTGELRAAHAVVHRQAKAIRIDRLVDRAAVRSLVGVVFPSLVDLISDVLDTSARAVSSGTKPDRPGN